MLRSKFCFLDSLAYTTHNPTCYPVPQNGRGIEIFVLVNWCIVGGKWKRSYLHLFSVIYTTFTNSLRKLFDFKWEDFSTKQHQKIIQLLLTFSLIRRNSFSVTDLSTSCVISLFVIAGTTVHNRRRCVRDIHSERTNLLRSDHGSHVWRVARRDELLHHLAPPLSQRP